MTEPITKSVPNVQCPESDVKARLAPSPVRVAAATTLSPHPAAPNSMGRFTTVWDSPRRPRDAEAFHAGFERGGLNAEKSGRATTAADAPGR